jgi:phospholipid/cholesterol/gamma-HCH transport system substrate-binding protein
VGDEDDGADAVKVNARLTLVILAILTLFGTGYMWLGVLDMGPTKRFTHLTLMLNSSGGLLPTSPVTMRGINVGRVTGIQTTRTGLAVSLDLDATHPVPANSQVSVQNLSAAGEQFIDFTPTVIAPPYFTDGAQIPAARVAPTVTVSDLLARVHALFSALNPDDLHTVVSNVAEAFANNDDTLDSLATTAGLFANVVRDDKRLLATLFSNVSTLTSGLGELHAGEVFSETGRLLPSAVPAFVRLVHSFDVVSHVGNGILASDEAVGQLVAKVSEYLDDLAGPLGTFATVLQPVTAPLHGVKVDSGHWLDFWESTFSDDGGVRVHLTVPEWQHP